jgi:hypothetical protein
MRPYQRFRHTVSLTVDLDCEKHLCGRCVNRKPCTLSCVLFGKDLQCTKGGYPRRLAECKSAEVSSRPDPHTANERVHHA